MKKIAVLGGAVMDYVFKVEALKSRSTQAESFYSWPGGKGLNQAIALARQDIDVTMISAVGMDHPGEQILTFLNKNGISCAHIARIKGAQTAVTNVIVDNRGDPYFVGFKSVVQSNVDQELILRAKKAIKAADVLMITLEVSLGAISAALELAKQNEKLIVLNASPPLESPHTFPLSLLQYVDAIILSSEEAIEILGSDQSSSASTLAMQLFDQGVKLVCVATPDQSYIVVSREGPGKHLPPDKDPLDKTGMSDAFCATLAVALSQQVPLDIMIDRAKVAGMLAMTKLGGSPSMPFLQEIDALCLTERSI